MKYNSSVKLWKSVCIACEPEFEDLVSTLIFESGFFGLEELASTSSASGTDSTSGWAPSSPKCDKFSQRPSTELAEVRQIHFKAYYPLPISTSLIQTSPDPLDTLRKLLETTFGKDAEKRVDICRVEIIPAEDWEKSWRAGLGAVEAGKRLVIRPSWVDYRNSDERIEIIIDPKMAFGTGSHATTFLCLEALERMDIAGSSVIDAGCGSGVLSIAAAKLGASKVFAFDNDPFSVDNARENVEINKVQDIVQVELADIEEISSRGPLLESFLTEPHFDKLSARPLAEPVEANSLAQKTADLVLANLIYNLLIRELPVLRSCINHGGKIVFSGLLAEQETPFLENIHREGFHVLSIAHREEWIAVVAEDRIQKTEVRIKTKEKKN